MRATLEILEKFNSLGGFTFLFEYMEMKKKFFFLYITVYMYPKWKMGPP